MLYELVNMASQQIIFSKFSTTIKIFNDCHLKVKYNTSNADHTAENQNGQATILNIYRPVYNEGAHLFVLQIGEGSHRCEYYYGV